MHHMHASHEWVLEKTAVLWALSNLKTSLKGIASRLHQTVKGKSNPRWAYKRRAWMRQTAVRNVAVFRCSNMNSTTA